MPAHEINLSNIDRAFDMIAETAIEAVNDALLEQADHYRDLARESIDRGQAAGELAAHGARIPPNPVNEDNPHDYGLRKQADLGHTKGLHATGTYRDSIEVTRVRSADGLQGVQVGVDPSLPSSGYRPPTPKNLARRERRTGSVERKRRFVSRWKKPGKWTRRSALPKLIQIAYRLEFGTKLGQGGIWSARPRPLWGPLWKLAISHARARGELQQLIRRKLRFAFGTTVVDPVVRRRPNVNRFQGLEE